MICLWSECKKQMVLKVSVHTIQYQYYCYKYIIYLGILSSYGCAVTIVYNDYMI